MNRLLKIATTLSVTAGLLVGCGGQNIKPVELNNPVISVESRRFVADAEDAVSIARARVSQRRDELERARQNRDDLLSREQFEEADSSVRDKLRAMLDERVELQALRTELAEADLELAQQKLELAHAQTAVRHDLRTYDLEPVRDEVEERLAEVREIKSSIADKLIDIDKVTRAWWKTYDSSVAGTELADAFFTPNLPRQSSPFWITAERIQELEEGGDDETDQEGDEKDNDDE